MNNRGSLIKLKSLLKSSMTIHQNMSTMAAVNPSIIQTINPFAQEPIFQNIIKDSRSNPKIICHRGRSDLYPENTIESITQGLFTSDLVEFDVMLTKDEQVIVFHDRFLGEITNIQSLPEFGDRKTINNLNQFGQLPRSEWWVKEFTLKELKKLSVKQKHSSRPQIDEKLFKIPTLEQVIKQTLQMKGQIPNDAGILMQIKTERQNVITSERDVILLEKISEILKKYQLNTKSKCVQMNLPVIVQTFNHEAVKTFHKICPQIPLTHLYYEENEDICETYLMDHRTPSSIGVAVSTKHLRREFIQMCHKMEYQIFYWSVMDDHPQIPLGCSSYHEFYQSLKAFNIDGIITDFASNCKNALSLACY